MAYVKLVPVRHRRLGMFTAPDPLHQGAPSEFNVETYLLQAVGTKIVRTGVSTSGTSPQYAVASERDRRPRFLPEPVAALWLNGELPAAALPELLVRTAPRFSHRSDFLPGLRRRAHRPLLAAGTLILLVGAVGLALFWWWLQASGKGGTGLGPGYGRLVSAREWLGAPARAGSFVTVTGMERCRALAAVNVPGYSPPPARFAPLYGGAVAPTAVRYVLARVQAAGEQRLVLVSDYETHLLPEVVPSGYVLPTAWFGLPPAVLDQAARGADRLDAAVILTNHLFPAARRSFLSDPIFFWMIGGFVLILSGMFLVVGLVRFRSWRRSWHQLEELRAELNLPPPARGFRPDPHPTAERFGLD